MRRETRRKERTAIGDGGNDSLSGQPREPRSGKRGFACMAPTHLLLREAQLGPLAQPALVLQFARLRRPGVGLRSGGTRS